MRKQLTYLASVVLFFAATVVSAETLQLVVEKVEDGDTIVVTLNGKTERLQLQGIDAPEDVENAKLKRDIKVTGLDSATLLPLGVAATQYLQMLVKPGDSLQVSGHFDQRDRYGRILVTAVDATGNSLNERMVQDGFAILTRYGKIEAKLKTRLERLESEAIAAKQGLWSEAALVARAWSGRKN